MTVKQRVLELLKKGPLTSMQVAKILSITQASASTATKELRDAGKLHIASWDFTLKNRANRVYALGKSVDAPKPVRAEKVSTVFIPRPDVAAAWMMTKEYHG